MKPEITLIFCTVFVFILLLDGLKITRGYPTEFGVENLLETSLGHQLIWPIIREKT